MLPESRPYPAFRLLPLNLLHNHTEQSFLLCLILLYRCTTDNFILVQMTSRLAAVHGTNTYLLPFRVCDWSVTGPLGLGLGSYQFSSTVKVPTWTKRATRYYYNLFNVSALPARWGRYSTWLKGGVIQGYWWSVAYSTHFKFQVNIPTFHLQIKISQNRWGYGNGAAVLHMSSHMRGQLNI